MTAVVFDEERNEWVEGGSVLAVFGDEEDDPFRGSWDRSGAVRGTSTRGRTAAHPVDLEEERLWPTPAASTPNDGEAPATWLARFVKHASAGPNSTRAGVPLAVAARAPIVLRVARVGTLDMARDLLARHEHAPVDELASVDVLNPAWVELLMGFPMGWTDV